MGTINEKHKYSQQATKALLVVFFSTTGLVLLLITAMIIFKIWWPLFMIAAIVAGWYLFNSQRKTVPLYDLTAKVNITVANKDWVAFKKQYPLQVVANGKKKE